MLHDKELWVRQKIYADLDSLLRTVNSWRAAGQTIAFTNGCFDILHHGHFDYLARAASFANRLVVGVNADASVKHLKGAARPVTGEEDRLYALASLMVVDAVLLFDEDTPLRLIKTLQPDVLAKGGDYALHQIVGAQEVLARGGSVEIIPFVSGYSTTGLLEVIRSL